MRSSKLNNKNKWPKKCPKCGSITKIELTGGWRCGRCNYVHLETQEILKL